MEVPVKEGSYNICNVLKYWKKESVPSKKNKAAYGIVWLDDLIKHTYCNIWFKNNLD